MNLVSDYLATFSPISIFQWGYMPNIRSITSVLCTLTHDCLNYLEDMGKEFAQCSLTCTKHLIGYISILPCAQVISSKTKHTFTALQQWIPS